MFFKHIAPESCAIRNFNCVRYSNEWLCNLLVSCTFVPDIAARKHFVVAYIIIKNSLPKRPKFIIILLEMTDSIPLVMHDARAWNTTVSKSTGVHISTLLSNVCIPINQI